MELIVRLDRPPAPHPPTTVLYFDLLIGIFIYTMLYLLFLSGFLFLLFLFKFFLCPQLLLQVRKRSKACRAGLREADELVSINEQPCGMLSHAQAMNLIDSSTGILHIRVKRSEEEQKKCNNWFNGSSKSQILRCDAKQS